MESSQFILRADPLLTLQVVHLLLFEFLCIFMPVASKVTFRDFLLAEVLRDEVMAAGIH